MYTWFCDRLGFLSYPVELFVSILEKISTIDFSEPVIYIPDIQEPSTGQVLIHSTSYNFNDLVCEGIWKNVHDIYLIVVDAIIIFALVNLAKNKFEEVTKS